MHLESTHEIWTALQTRFQSSNRSKEYLTDIKKIVDQFTSVGSTLDTEDIIIYILNGLPPPYQLFKTSIRHLQSPLGRCGRGRTQTATNPPTKTASKSSLICQICTKRGHTTDVCCHRHNANYITPSPQSNTGHALLASSDTTSTDWYLDSGASSHMTYDSDNLSNASSYHGSDQITVGDGRTIPIAHSGTRILPTRIECIPLALLHSDVWGPSPVPSHQGLRYYLLIVDDYS
ncbi:uncharacterized protein LOC110115768 [Dendrobium catenatum]|uniref:uncharacterized protein LOC110115768 n=1 Tax=Dendrobium catenatum TaxID=906689 RepID=UPI0009F540E1|nr:uncharacterized protein LOC110115768 [Dendrobium catenatum]